MGKKELPTEMYEETTEDWNEPAPKVEMKKEVKDISGQLKALIDDALMTIDNDLDTTRKFLKDAQQLLVDLKTN